MLCEDCRKPAKTLYWVDSLGSLVCAACLPKHAEQASEGIVVTIVIPMTRIEAQQQAMRLETKAP